MWFILSIVDKQKFLGQKIEQDFYLYTELYEIIEWNKLIEFRYDSFG